MAVQLKPGVRVVGLRPETLLAVLVARDVYAERGDSLTVTSIVEGRHMPGSLHYVGQAVDLRLPRGDVARVVETLAGRLGNDYDVVREATHVHVEFQPKVGVNVDGR